MGSIRGCNKGKWTSMLFCSSRDSEEAVEKFKDGNYVDIVEEYCEIDVTGMDIADIDLNIVHDIEIPHLAPPHLSTCPVGPCPIHSSLQGHGLAGQGAGLGPSRDRPGQWPPGPRTG